MNIKTYLPWAIALAMGVLIGWFLKPAESHEAHSHATEAGASIWTCSMDPQVRQPNPGKCPLCGMDLIPLEDDAEGSDDPIAVRMSPSAMQLASVATAKVGRGKAEKSLRLNGKVFADERRIYSQSSHIPGRIEKLAINFTGDAVQKGQNIATVYAPELATAQEELFQALKMKDSYPQLATAAREKLKNWKLTDAQIDAIVQQGTVQGTFPILADVSGIVLQKKVNLGDYLMRGQALYEVADLSTVWVLFDIYESDMAWVKVGSEVAFTVPSLPSQTFKGRVSYIDPVIDPMTRVAKARVEMGNAGLRLKPEMFVSGTVSTVLSGKENAIMVPKSAVMWTGKRSVVYVKVAESKGVSFAMREVKLGMALGDSYVIEGGLSEGEEIAVNGTFSIDAAAQLAGKPSMMGLAPSASLPTEGQQAIQELLKRYLALKDALVASNAAEAQQQAKLMQAHFGGISANAFGEAQAQWEQHSPYIAKALQTLKGNSDLAEQRAHFQHLSDAMVALAKNFRPENLYVQHCPMASNNQGAYWLSLSKEIRNPYFGNQMLQCGSVKAEIRQ